MERCKFYLTCRTPKDVDSWSQVCIRVSLPGQTVMYMFLCGSCATERIVEQEGLFVFLDDDDRGSWLGTAGREIVGSIMYDLRS